MTARPIYRRKMTHALESKSLGGSNHNLKIRRDSSQNSKHILQQTRSLKWKIQQYKPVQVIYLMVLSLMVLSPESTPNPKSYLQKFLLRVDSGFNCSRVYKHALK